MEIDSATLNLTPEPVVLIPRDAPFPVGWPGLRFPNRGVTVTVTSEIDLESDTGRFDMTAELFAFDPVSQSSADEPFHTMAFFRPAVIGTVNFSFRRLFRVLDGGSKSTIAWSNTVPRSLLDVDPGFKTERKVGRKPTTTGEVGPRGEPIENTVIDGQIISVTQTPNPDHIVAKVTLAQNDQNGNLNVTQRWTNVVVAPLQKPRLFL